MTSSLMLREFYLWWIGRENECVLHTTISPPYDVGLCSSLQRWYRNACWRDDYTDIQARDLSNEMVRQFKDAGLNIYYPFNRGSGEYDFECWQEICRDNPDRRAWVEARLRDMEDA